MSPQPVPLSAPPRRVWIPWFVLASMLLLTAVATAYVYMATEIRDRARFNDEVRTIQGNIADRLNIYTNMLRSATGLFAADENLSARQFRAYVERLRIQELYPGIQGVGFTRRVSPAEKEQLTAAMRRQGITVLAEPDQKEIPFRIWPDHPRDEYHTIVYLEPTDVRNHHAIGYDMFTEATRRAAMEQARDTGRPVASGPVTLVQEIDEDAQPGFLIYVPVYRGGGIPETVEERRAMLDGFVYSPFRTYDLLSEILGNPSEPLVNVRIYDGTETSQENELYRSGRLYAPIDPSYRPSFTRTVELPVAGRTWTIRFRTRPAFDEASTSSLLPAVPLLGMILSGVLFYLTSAQARARATAEQTARELQLADEALRHSEGRLRRVVESNLVGVVFGDLLGQVSEVNGAYAQLIGYSRQDILSDGLGWDDWKRLTPPEFHEADERAVQQLRTRGTCTPYEKELIHRDGRRVPVLVGAALLEDSPGECVALVIDLTERKRAEDARLESLSREQAALREAQAAQRRLAFLADASKVLVSSLDYQGTLSTIAHLAVPYLADWCLIYAVDRQHTVRRMAVVHANPTRAQLAESLRQEPLDLNHPTHLVARALREGRPILVPRMTGDEIVTALPNIHRINAALPSHGLSMVVVPLQAQGKPIGAISLISDESQRQYGPEDLAFAQNLAERASTAIENALLYAAAQEARTEAERANQLKDEFLATVSHELRTPLNAILGWSQLLQSGKMDPDEVEQGLESIDRNAKVQAQLVEDLLDVSRIVAGKLRLEARPVHLVPIIEAAMDTVRPAAQARGVRLEQALNSAAGTVLGDPNRLQQVVWNLLSNSIKFTPQGGVVRVGLERIDSQAQITVTDTGQGIAPEFLPHLFTPFSQADGSTTRRHGGLGLGLAIVRRLVELHGGTVSAASEGKGRGATFTVSLPLSAGRIPVFSLEPERPGDVPAAALGSSRTKLEGIRVLVVDDEPDVRELIRHALARVGAEVILAASAREAFEAFRQFRPHVLLSDIAMPEEDGYSLLRRIRRLPHAEGGQVPAVALTAFARPEDHRHTAEAGFQIHLVKPVAPAEFIAAVAGLAGQAALEEIMTRSES